MSSRQGDSYVMRVEGIEVRICLELGPEWSAAERHLFYRLDKGPIEIPIPARAIVRLEPVLLDVQAG